MTLQLEASSSSDASGGHAGSPPSPPHPHGGGRAVPPAPSSLAGWGPGAVCPRCQTRVLGSGPPPPARYPSPLYSLVSTRIILVDGLGKVIYRRGDENTLASYFQNTLPVPKEFYRALRVSREKTGGAVPPSLTSIPAAAAGTLPTGGGELWCDGSEVIHLSMPGGAFTDAALTATLQPGRRTLTRATGLALITVRLPDPHLDHARLAGLPCGLHEGK